MPQLWAAGGAAAHATGTGVANALIGDAANDDALEAERQGLWDALKIQEKGANTSMDYQKAQAQRALEAFMKYAGQARADLDPFRKAANEALKQQQGLTDPNSPIYQQQRQAMTSQIQRQLAAQGLLRSKNQSDLLTNMELGLEQQRVNTIAGLANPNVAIQSANINQGLGNAVAGVEMGLGSSMGQQINNLAALQAQAVRGHWGINAAKHVGEGKKWTDMLTAWNNASQQFMSSMGGSGIMGGGGGGQGGGGGMGGFGGLMGLFGGGGGQEPAPAPQPAMQPPLSQQIGGYNPMPYYSNWR